MVDVFEEMRNSLSKGPPSEAEAYCIANIIKINFIFFKNYDFELYKKLNSRIEFIFDKIDKDEYPEWYLELGKINEKIEEKIIKKKEEEKNKKINDLNIFFKQIIKEKKPKEFFISSKISTIK